MRETNTISSSMASILHKPFHPANMAGIQNRVYIESPDKVPNHKGSSLLTAKNTLEGSNQEFSEGKSDSRDITGSSHIGILLPCVSEDKILWQTPPNS